MVSSVFNLSLYSVSLAPFLHSSMSHLSYLSFISFFHSYLPISSFHSLHPTPYSPNFTFHHSSISPTVFASSILLLPYIRSSSKFFHHFSSIASLHVPKMLILIILCCLWFLYNFPSFQCPINFPFPHLTILFIIHVFISLILFTASSFFYSLTKLSFTHSTQTAAFRYTLHSQPQYAVLVMWWLVCPTNPKSYASRTLTLGRGRPWWTDQRTQFRTAGTTSSQN